MTGWEYKTVQVPGGSVFRKKVDKQDGDPHLKAMGFGDWELVTQEVDLLLNTMGLDGWELVTAVAYAVAYGGTVCLLYTFKRPLS